MKFFSVVLFFFLAVPYFQIEKVVAFFSAGATYFTSQSLSSTALLLATGLIGLIGISRRS